MTIFLGLTQMPWGWRLWKFKNINFISKFKRNFICLINNKLSLIRFEFYLNTKSYQHFGI